MVRCGVRHRWKSPLFVLHSLVLCPPGGQPPRGAPATRRRVRVETLGGRWPGAARALGTVINGFTADSKVRSTSTSKVRSSRLCDTVALPLWGVRCTRRRLVQMRVAAVADCRLVQSFITHPGDEVMVIGSRRLEVILIAFQHSSRQRVHRGTLEYFP